MAFDRFVKAIAAGRFPRLNDREDLWQVLLMLTSRIASNAARDERREKRGGGGIVQSITPVGDSAGSGLPVASSEPGPADAAAMAEAGDEMLSALKDPLLRQIAILALEGYTNMEIAEKIERVVSTVERKLNRIREIWTGQGFV